MSFANCSCVSLSVSLILGLKGMNLRADLPMIRIWGVWGITEKRKDEEDHVIVVVEKSPGSYGREGG